MEKDKKFRQSIDESVKELLSGGGKDIPLFKVFMPESVIEPVRQVLMSGYIGEGPRVEQFEQQLARWFDNDNVLATNNGEFLQTYKKAGITVSQVHARNDFHTMVKDFRTPLPGVDEFTTEQVSIPVGWWLTENDLEHIINTVIDYDRSCRPKLKELTSKPSQTEVTARSAN